VDYKLIIFGLFAVIMGAYAHSAELSGTCDVSSTQCDITVNDFEVCNTSNATETYTAFFQGGASQWFSIIPNRVTLEPGKCAELKAFTVAGCYADPGQYFTDLVVQNDERVTVSCEFNLEQGHFVEIEVEPENQEATQCEEKIYDLIVTNNTIVPNQQIERVDLTISGIPKDWYVLEEERILVKKGEPETVKLRVQAPCDADFADYEFTARATLPNPNFYDEDNGIYSLDQGQSIQILPDTGFRNGLANACLETPSEGIIKFANNGKLQDTLKLTLEGASFAALETRNITLAPGQEKEVKIKFNQTSEEIGTYDFTLKVESTQYDFSTQKTFKAELSDCYNLKVVKLEGEELLCNEDSPDYRFEITNTGIETVDLEASLTGVSAELDKTNITLAPGETTELNAELDISTLAREATISKNDLAVELVIDASGSMAERINGHNKMEVAKTAITSLVNNINEIDLGLRVFGQGELCENSELLVPVQKLDITKITDKISGFTPKGKTPLTEALNAAINDFPAGKDKAIILVSDGKETCDGNIRATAIALASKGIVVYSIGFDIDAEGKEQLQEISNRTKGKYFEARSSEELLKVLQTISQELNITPSREGKRTFTLNLDSAHFDYEKDYSVTVSDCFNATIVVPELNLCKGVDKGDVVTLVNLGSENQEFNLNYTPSWIEGQATANVPANGQITIPITAKTPIGATNENYTIKAISGTIELEQTKNINYLSEASCFGVDLIIVKPELNAETCEGVKQTIFVENRGVVAQKVTLTIDKPWVEVVQNTITVQPGERAEMNFFVSPPFDLEDTTFLNLTITTDRGFKTEGKVLVRATGNQESFGLGEVDLRVRDLNIMNVEGLYHDVEVTFDIYNDSNRTLEVFNAKTLDYNGVVQLDKRFISAKDTVMAKVLVDLPEALKGKTVTIPIQLETDEGTYVRNITFQYGGTQTTPEETEVDEPVSIGTGLFTLAGLSTALLVVLIIVVIGLIIFSAYKAVQKEEKQEIIEAPVDDAETKAAKEKLAELKGKITETKPAKKKVGAASKGKAKKK